MSDAVLLGLLTATVGAVGVILTALLTFRAARLKVAAEKEAARIKAITDAEAAAVKEQEAYLNSSGSFRTALLARITELETKNDAREQRYEERMAALDARNSQLSDENHDLARKLKEAQARIAELEAEVAALKAKQVVS